MHYRKKECNDIEICTEKKIKVPDEVKDMPRAQGGKLNASHSDSTAHLTFRSEHRGRYRVEVTIENNGTFSREQAHGDMHASIDSACATLVGRSPQERTRLEKRLREGAFEKAADEDPAESVTEEGEFDVVRSRAPSRSSP